MMAPSMVAMAFCASVAVSTSMAEMLFTVEARVAAVKPRLSPALAAAAPPTSIPEELVLDSVTVPWLVAATAVIARFPSCAAEKPV